MNGYLQSAIAENTLLELFSRSTSPEPTKIVAYLTYHFVGMEEAFAAIQQLRKQKMRVRLLIDDTMFHYFSKKEIVKLTENDDWITLRTLEKTEDIDHLFLPILSFSLVSGIISFNDQHPFVRFVLQSLLSGKKVSALSIGANPNHSIWLKNGLTGATPLFKNTILTQLQKLKGLGVHLIEPEDGLSYFSNQMDLKRKVYTGKDIKNLLSSNQKEIIIDQQSIMTPLALDLLKQHQIILIRK